MKTRIGLVFYMLLALISVIASAAPPQLDPNVQQKASDRRSIEKMKAALAVGSHPTGCGD